PFYINPSTTALPLPSLHDALPISFPRSWSPTAAARPSSTEANALTSRSTSRCSTVKPVRLRSRRTPVSHLEVERDVKAFASVERSEEHTSELQSRGHLVCRLLFEK